VLKFKNKFGSLRVNAHWQFKQLLNLRSNFRFNTLWLAAFYYANPLFLMGVSILVYAFLFTPLSQVRNSGVEKKLGVPSFMEKKFEELFTVMKKGKNCV
jgi:hypothetical protein